MYDKYAGLFLTSKISVIEQKDRMNEMDSVGVGIVGMCITACFMELWVTMFAGRGKAAL